MNSATDRDISNEKVPKKLLDVVSGAVSHCEDEQTLLARAQAGDGEAFWRLVEPHLHQIYCLAIRITRNHEDAEDSSQECLVRAMTSLQTFRSDSKFSTWLNRIAINEALMRVRKRKSERKYIWNDADLSEMPDAMRIRDRGDHADPEAVCRGWERSELLRDALKKLSEESRMAIHFHQTAEIPTKEVARALHMSNSGVKSRLRRALDKLRGVLCETMRCREAQVRGWI